MNTFSACLSNMLPSRIFPHSSSIKILHETNFHKYADNFFIGSAVERSIKRGNGRGGRRVGIDMRTADAANGVCRAVLLMVRMQNEQNVESAFQRGIGPVLRFRSPEKHVQKISRIAEIVVGIHVRHAQRVPVSKSRDRWHLANQAVSLLLA